MVDFGQIVEGGAAAFTLIAVNKAGRQVPAPGPFTVAVASDPLIGTVTVNPDGTGGLVTAGSTDGAGSFSADCAGLASDNGQWATVADTTAVAVKIVPDPAVAVKIV